MTTEPKNNNEICDLLEINKGWGYVNKNNVDELITIAIERNNKKLEKALRDWR